MKEDLIYVDCSHCGGYVWVQDDNCWRCGEWFKPGELRMRYERTLYVKR